MPLNCHPEDRHRRTHPLRADFQSALRSRHPDAVAEDPHQGVSTDWPVRQHRLLLGHGSTDDGDAYSSRHRWNHHCWSQVCLHISITNCTSKLTLTWHRLISDPGATRKWTFRIWPICVAKHPLLHPLYRVQRWPITFYRIFPLFRVLYIKCQNIILVVGEKRLFNCSKWAGCSISIILTLGNVIEHNVYLPASHSHLLSQSFFKSMTWETQTAPGYTQYITAITVVIFNWIEFIFFVIIIGELFENQQTLNAICISTSTNPAMARRRVRKNSITASGHFICWLIEITILFGVQVVVARQREDQNSMSLASWVFATLLPSINYCILPMSQISTSPELRSHMFSSISCECMVCSCGDEAAEEEIVLNIIYNPNAPSGPPLVQG